MNSTVIKIEETLIIEKRVCREKAVSTSKFNSLDNFFFFPSKLQKITFSI